MADGVTIESGSPERVAFDLMVRIWVAEHQGRSTNPQEARTGMLDLYGECLKAVRGTRSAAKVGLSGH